MKKLIILFALCAMVLLCKTTDAQIRFSVNLSTQPVWGPTGYDNVQYYYLPDIEVYYNVPQRRFVYLENNRWRTSAYLPSRYRNYDLYNTRKIVINEPRPYMNHKVYQARYASWNEHQQSIRDSRDSRYFANKNHPEYNNWKNSQRYQKSNQKNQKQKENQRNQNWNR